MRRAEQTLLTVDDIGIYPERLFSERGVDCLRLLAEVRASGRGWGSISLRPMHDKAIARLEDAIVHGTLQEVYVFACICAANCEEHIFYSLERIDTLYEEQSAKDASARDRCRLAAALSAFHKTCGE